MSRAVFSFKYAPPFWQPHCAAQFFFCAGSAMAACFAMEVREFGIESLAGDAAARIKKQRMRVVRFRGTESPG
jgi:hypothetical protein